jgi:hypothetical protein
MRKLSEFSCLTQREGSLMGYARRKTREKNRNKPKPEKKKEREAKRKKRRMTRLERTKSA